MWRVRPQRRDGALKRARDSGLALDRVEWHRTDCWAQDPVVAVAAGASSARQTLPLRGARHGTACLLSAAVVLERVLKGG